MKYQLSEQTRVNLRLAQQVKTLRGELEDGVEIRSPITSRLPNYYNNDNDNNNNNDNNDYNEHDERVASFKVT